MALLAAVAVVLVAPAGTAGALEGEPILIQDRHVRVADVQIHGVGLDDAAPLTAEISAVLDRYLGGAVVTGLLTGQPADVADTFTSAARARLSSDDRPILVEDDILRPAVVDVRRFRADLLVLSGPGKVAEVVVANISHLAVGFGGDTGQVRVGRDGQLVFVHQDGAWRIDSYDLEVNRTRSPLPPLSLLWPFGREA